MSSRDIRSKFLESIHLALYGKRIFASVIKLRIVRRRDNPGLSVWAPNIITSILMTEKQREILCKHRRKGDIKMEAESGMKQPQAKECWQPPEAGTVKEQVLP